jgi:hypothetical protein
MQHTRVWFVNDSMGTLELNLMPSAREMTKPR